MLSRSLFRTVTVEQARAEGEKIRLVGQAEADAIEAVGKAEAERMRLKANAYKQYGEAAMLSLVLETLPKVCYSHHSSFLTHKIALELRKHLPRGLEISYVFFSVH